MSAARDDQLPDSATTARIIELGDGFLSSWALYVAATLRLADLIAEGKTGADELARATSTDADALFRVLRHLGSLDVVTEGPPRHFELTQLGQRLRSRAPGSVRSWLEMNGPVFRAFAEDPLASVRSGEPAFEAVFGSDFWGYAAKNPEWGRTFDESMTEVTRETAAAVADAYRFDGLRRIVDVGGGRGIFLSALLTKYPEATGVIFDLPHVVAHASGEVAAAGVSERCEIVGGDFFDEVPQGGDAYILSWIIHDWDDVRARSILASCRGAMRDQGRLLLVEAVLPTSGAAASPFATGLDLVMLVALSGRERTELEYATLLAAEGFTLTRVVHTASPLSVIEAVPVL